MVRREELQKAAKRERLEARKEKEREEDKRRQREDGMRDRERIAQEQRIQTDIEFEEWQDFVNKENPILSESLDLPQVCACLRLTDVASFIIICYDLSVLPPLVKKLRLSTVSPQMLHYRLQSTELGSMHKLDIC